VVPDNPNFQVQMWAANHTKTDVVVPIVRVVVVAIRGAQVVLIVVESPAAQRPGADIGLPVPISHKTWRNGLDRIH